MNYYSLQDNYKRATCSLPTGCSENIWNTEHPVPYSTDMELVGQVNGIPSRAMEQTVLRKIFM